MKNNLKKPMLEGGLVLCWSSGFIGAVLASETSSVFLVLLWRFVLASILLAPFLIPYLKRSFLPVIALQSLVGAFAMFGYLVTGVKAIDIGVPTGTAAMVASLQPLATAALAGVVLQETVTRSGRLSEPGLLKHVSPLGWEHINLTGDFDWHSGAADRSNARPLHLRSARTAAS